ncbi:hypothetical protein N9251_03420, partial [Gammaproteobacteria bacterium]|nr:hypothetical protein [Gammaproteobacteria bacterium]
MIEYTADQSNAFATCRYSFVSEFYGDTIVFNGQTWIYSANLTNPTDFKSAADFVTRFNNNADYNRDYKAVKVLTAPGANEIIVITARVATSESNIVTSVTGGIILDYNFVGENQYSKNDISQFAQILRIEESNTDNEKRTLEPVYSFEISSQIRGRLTPFKIEDGTGVIFQNDGSFGTITTEIGTSFIDVGDTIQQ